MARGALAGAIHDNGSQMGKFARLAQVTPLGFAAKDVGAMTGPSVEASSSAAATAAGTAQEQTAIYAFLQRSEVRLSTVHRVAGAFLSGAALLVLLPILLTDVVLQLLLETLRLPIPTLALALQLTALLTMSLLPLYALYSLFRDLVEFYFTHDYPEAKNAGFYPRFILSGITLAEEEAPVTKALAREAEMNALDFVVPAGPSERKNLLRLYRFLSGSAADAGVPEGQRVVPPRRMAYVNGHSAGALEYEQRLAYWTAYALAGSTDRSLAQEVAKAEASLVRHTGLLRRLVLRYAKAVLTLIWATVIFIALTLVRAYFRGQDPAASVSELEFFMLVTLPLVWALLAGYIARRPVIWISARGRPGEHDPTEIGHDPHLVRFELAVLVASLVVAIAEGILLATATAEAWAGSASPGTGGLLPVAWGVWALALGAIGRQGLRHARFALVSR